MMPISNDHLELKPRTGFDGPALRFDFPRLRIGVAEYEEGPTGCTVFLFEGGADTAVDVRGGLVGMTQEYEFCDAICLAGGSLLGLEAAAGVTAGIFAGRDYTWQNGMPLVNGAIIFDYRRRETTIYPDKALGRAALDAARPGFFPLGARGAGRAAGAGAVLDRARSESSGQGGAFRQVGALKLAVFTVANPFGTIVDRTGRVVRGNLDHASGERKGVREGMEQLLAGGTSPEPLPGNTTLTVLVTNQKLDRHSLTQLGRQVHSSMVRAIQPFHTVMDGDVFYTVSTAEVESELNVTMLGIIAEELAWDAVLAAVGA